MVGEKSISKNAPVDSASYNIGIGDDPQYNGRAFNGLLDNVMVLKKALTKQEIQENYKVPQEYVVFHSMMMDKLKMEQLE